ncbi:Uncharacterized protein FWK35_00032571, partial [Aphis craccivora]
FNLFKFNLKKAGKWVPLCCTLGAVWITIILCYRSVKFESNDIIYTKNFMIFQLQNYLQIFAFSTDFLQ